MSTYLLISLVVFVSIMIQDYWVSRGDQWKRYKLTDPDVLIVTLAVSLLWPVTIPIGVYLYFRR